MATAATKYIRNEDGHFVCPTCGVVKEKQNTMYYHMKRHADELPHTCKVCKKSFLQKQTLDLHMKSKHSTAAAATHEFMCPFDGCEFGAHTKGNCRTHFFRTHFMDEVAELLMHDKDAGTIECMGCDRTFNSLGLFYYHCGDCLGGLPADDPRRSALDSLK
jgi:hypothetical protein